MIPAPSSNDWADTVNEVQKRLDETLDYMKKVRPTHRSEMSRRWAVSITEMEKVVAYYSVYVTQN